MARVLTVIDSTWYEELSVVSYYSESQFEQKVLSHAEFVFPDYYVIKYKKVMQTSYKKTSIPDLMMIRKNYEDWWIVEVEKAEHDIDHVLDQVEVFNNVELNAIEAAKYIANQSTDIDEDEVKKLIRRKKAKVLVIVDQPKDGWKKELKKHDTKLCVFQVFKNTSGIELYRINGEYPYVFTGNAHCRMVTNLVNTMEVINPDILNIFKQDDELELNFKGQLTKWRIFIARHKMYLKSISSTVNKLPVGKDYVIRKDTFNRYHVDFN